VLLLDEPANGLDPEGIAWLRTFLQSFARSGRTVLVSSHILSEVEQTVDQLIIISRGQTMYNGPLEHLRRSQQARVLVRPSDPEKLMAALRDAGIYNLEPTPDGRIAVVGVQPEQVADIALKAGVSVYGIEEERVNLEQLYFSLTQGQYTPGTVPQQFGPGQQPYQMAPPTPQSYQVQQPYQQPQTYQPQYQQQPYQPQPDQYQPPPQYQPQQGYPPQGYPPTGTPPTGSPVQDAAPLSPWQQQVPAPDAQQPGQADPAQHDQGGLGGKS
jgi:ABC-2 type transport system ATP-binding protein